MLVNAILLAALAVQSEEAANRHTGLVILVEEAAGVALHAQAAEPVAADGLPEAAAVAMGAGRRRRVEASGGGSGVVVGGRREGRAGGDGGGGRRGGDGCGGGGGVEAALEVEAKASVRLLHG